MDALVILRQRAGLSRAKAARRIGLNPSTLYLWETGRRQPTAVNLLRLAALYDVDPREIILPDRYQPAHDEDVTA